MPAIGIHWAACALGACLAFPGRAAAQEPELFELHDSLRIARLWAEINPGPLPAGEFQALIPSGDTLADVVVLWNGTEAGCVSRSAWRASAEGSPHGATRPGGRTPPDEEVPLVWSLFRVDGEKLLRWTDWPRGIKVGMGAAFSNMPSAKPQFERRIDLVWGQKFYRYFLLEGGMHRSQFGGGLTQRWTADSVPGGEFWGKPYWWWSVSAGVPALRYTVHLADQPLPGYFWLETGATKVMNGQSQGKVVNQWDRGFAASAGNLAHSLDLRLARFHYSLDWDADAYNVPVQAFLLEDLPAVFGNWGAGLVMASDVLATRFWLDVLDLSFSLPKPQTHPTDFRFAFLHFDLAYRSAKSFQLGFSLKVLLDNRILNLPGA